MLTSCLTAFGKPADVLRVRESAPPQPGEGELLLEMVAAPVNPADLNVIEGKYGELPVLPAVIGNEGVGRVAALGPKVKDFSEGDLVLPMRRGSWTQLMLTAAAEAVRLPPEIDVYQAAMLSVNPASAWGLLEGFVSLRPGDWVAQNAANSAVGRCVVQMARCRGLKTLNVVRRPDVVQDLKVLGADAVFLEGQDLREASEGICNAARPCLALNAVGGASALNLANALADRGTLVTYGAMGRQPLKIPNGLLIFRELEFKGFWLSRWSKRLSPARKKEIWSLLAKLSLEGKLRLPVHRVYPLLELLEALEEAARESRSGKVLIDLRV